MLQINNGFSINDQSSICKQDMVKGKEEQNCRIEYGNEWNCCRGQNKWLHLIWIALWSQIPKESSCWNKTKMLLSSASLRKLAWKAFPVLRTTVPSRIARKTREFSIPGYLLSDEMRQDNVIRCKCSHEGLSCQPTQEALNPACNVVCLQSMCQSQLHYNNNSHCKRNS